jgi:hypothetical protein
MTTIADAFQAGIDAVVADNTLNRAGFVDAVQTVITARFNNAQGNAWVDAVAAEMNRVGSVNNPSYTSMRNKIANNPVECAALFASLATITALPETEPAVTALKILDLRTERDEVQTSIDTLNAFKPGNTRQVRDAVNIGINNLRGLRQQIRDQLSTLIGDPDG